MLLTLIRVGQSNRGTFGVLRQGHVPFALTMEEPWRENQPSVSCIPSGRYRCKRVRSPKFGDTFEITSVPGRTHILFHKGNDLDDTEGCVMVAEEFSGTFDHPMVVSSQRGYGEFMALLKDEQEFDLDILDGPGIDTRLAA